VHGRPEGPPGRHHLLALWTYDAEPVEPTLPVDLDDVHPDVVLRGMSEMLPAMRGYLERVPRAYVDGGYYVKAPDNRPLIGPLPVEGAFVSAAFSGFGIMAACAGGELLAAHVTGSALPDYAPAFDPARFDSPGYLERFEGHGALGQL